MGIGAARIKSITRDGDTWILHVRYSQDSLTMRHSALLYVDAKKALVSAATSAAASCRKVSAHYNRISHSL